MFCILQFYVVDNACAQSLSWDDFVEKISTCEEDDEYGYMALMLEDLTDWHEHPFNLNAATQKDLEKLPFLDDAVIDDILFYVYRYGPMQSMGELKMISSLDYQEREFLALFAYVAPVEREREKVKLKTMLKEGKHEVLTRLDIPLYKRDGYIIPSDEVLLKNPNKVYLGNSLYHNLRYGFQYKDRLQWGVSAEKDAGEPFGSYGNAAYDSYHFYLMLKDCGKLKALVLGDYRLGFGEGLVVNSDFSLGKATMLNGGRRNTGIRKFSSFAENSCFRGVAATLGLGHTDVSLFYSYLPVDATLKVDGSISTLKTDGLHRTLLEVSKKHNVNEQSAGADVTWHNDRLDIGITALYQHFDRPFSTGSELYRRYYPSGKDFVNTSLHYSGRFHHFLFSGETAFSSVHKGWAMLNRITYKVDNRYSLFALQRLFTYQYTGLRARAFSEGGVVTNESGFYAGAEMQPLNGLKISVYADYFYFPWMKYGIPYTSDGFEGNLQLDWSPAYGKWSTFFNYQVKSKDRNGEPYLYNKLKMQLQYRPVASVNLKWVARYTNIRNRYGEHTHGYMSGITAGWKESKGRLSVNVSGAYFDSKDYKAPMSFYEPSLLYAFSFISFYGQGVRLAGNVRWNIGNHWMAIAKYGWTRYADRDEIGSGLQRIVGNVKSDIYLQLRCTF